MDRALLTGALLLAALVLAAGCGAMEVHDRPVPLDRDLREYAREARANLALLPEEQRRVVAPVLARHERAIARYDELLAQGDTRRTVQAPMVVAGAYFVGNDATGVGVADDVLLPFVALGVLATHLATDPPASSQALREGYQAVMLSAQVVRDVMERLQALGVTAAMSIAEVGTRQHCIDRYVDCQQNARKGFNRDLCQGCMDKCIVSDRFEWPQGGQCEYRQRGRPKRRPHYKF